MHILDKIVAFKKQEVASAKKQQSITDLEASPLFHRSCNSYRSRLAQNNATGIIAEFKRKSPSKAAINLDATVEYVTQGYADAGVDAISILTDSHFFGGSDAYLTQARYLLPTLPLLRKDFIIDEYQVIQAKSLGADIILLICEILSKKEVAFLAQLGRSLDMEVLLELHSDRQLSKCNEHVSIIGVNNRDLDTFEVDLDRSKNLYDLLPSDIPKIAESGLSHPTTAAMLYEYGFRGFLIGEQFMKYDDPGAACGTFIRQYMNQRNNT